MTEPESTAGTASPSASVRIKRAATWLLSFAVVAGAVWVLHRYFQNISIDELLAAMRRQPVTALAWSVALTALSFVALAAYDVMACHVVAKDRAGPGLAAFAGFTANAIANTLGFHAVTSSAVRARVYGKAGVGLADVARIISLSWLALGLGFLTMLALAMIWSDAATATSLGFPLHAIGWTLACLLLVFTVWLSRRPRELRFRSVVQPLPSARMAAMQLALGALESAAAIGALYVLLPPDLAPAFTLFSVVYIVAIWLGIAAHAPGGIGVFEATMAAALGGTGRSDLLAVLLIYRLIYNVLPFVLACLSMALFEWAWARSSDDHHVVLIEEEFP